MTANVESMAYQGKEPWHGLGVKVPDDLSPDEMVKAAGLEWFVRKEQMYLANKQPVMGNYALTRYQPNDNGELEYMSTLGVCGPKYEPTQNRDAFRFFQKFTKAGSMTLETAGSLDEGRQVWCLAKINENFVLPGNDKVEGYVLLYHPHIWGKALSIMFTPIRVVCQNTLTMALATKSGAFRMPHLYAFDDDVIVAAEETLGLSSTLLKGFKDNAEFLSSKKYSQEDVLEYIATLFDRRLLQEDEFVPGDFNRTAARVRALLKHQPGAEMKSANDTWWGAFNAVTYYVDHEAGNDRDTALKSAWFGQRAGLKRRALEAAIDFANAA